MSDVQAPGTEVRITATSGSITVVAEPRHDVVTDGQARVEVGADGAVEVVAKSKSITVRCPEGADTVVGTNSGSLRFQGRVGAVKATTTSGRIEVERATAVDARAMSGSITVD